MTKKSKPKKRGPDPEVLKTEGDAEDALDKLLGKGKPPTDERPTDDDEKQAEKKARPRD